MGGSGQSLAAKATVERRAAYLQSATRCGGVMVQLRLGERPKGQTESVSHQCTEAANHAAKYNRNRAGMPDRDKTIGRRERCKPLDSTAK
ncbi:hypothetical protein NDU88_006871 [Pleurodeles waltl]|uniref:Uncharacterized protein n=1 Tax=Pleurodeles waltl TaxID=8319 RepID=A0AAV7PPR0_PLEWA|nr:hypothetical protein NDU88_006871 [Pleurodeles waltl]